MQVGRSDVPAAPENETVSLSTTEYAVLGILAEGQTHGFALSKQLAADSEVGRVFTVRRPLVYRALDRLVGIGYAEPVATERGDAGPQRVIHQVTPCGRRQLRGWLSEPVEHVRDLRVGFLLKVALLRRQGRSPSDLIESQLAAILPTLAALDEATATSDDHVELWRRHNAAAAVSYLDDLAHRYRPTNP
jgi:DNA-binding PadR family transcriptional regulator